jgi:hypothetical protein
MKTWPLTLATALVAASTAGFAHADEPATQPETPTTKEAWIQCPRCHPEHWTSELSRPFMSLRLDAGYLYLKPRFAFGYGKPFSLWGGLDAVPLVTPDSAGGYCGLRVQIDWLELRAGARFVHAFLRQFLTPKGSYDLVDLAEDTGHPSNYIDLEAEVAATIPAGPGSVLVLGTVSSIQTVPAGFYVYDETLRVVVDPPPVFRARVGYSLPFMREANARLGVVGEVIEIPNRKAQVFRTGIVATYDIDDHIQAVATVVFPVYSPDSLGFLGADYTELGIRYRWATGHAHTPRELIPVPETAMAVPRHGVQP